MNWESLDVVRFDLGSFFRGQMRIDKLKGVYNSFIIDPSGLECETNLQDIVGWESSDIRFDLWLLALVSCLSGGYRFASVLQGLVWLSVVSKI